jgi:hypothetical protein
LDIGKESFPPHILLTLSNVVSQAENKTSAASLDSYLAFSGMTMEAILTQYILLLIAV